MSLLEVEDVTVRFGGHTALSSVSLTADSGRITGLIGPNGAGKTTMFNVITGQLDPTRGRVTLDGQDIGDRLPYQRARLGMARTFQRLELFGQLTVRENVQLAAGLQGKGPRVKPLSFVRPASPGKRFAASLLDTLLFVVTAGVGYLVWLMFAWRRGQTPAKQLLKLRYVDMNTGSYAGWRKSAYRDFVMKYLLLDVICAGLGLLIGGLMVFSKKNQYRAGWDRIAGTLVADLSPAEAPQEVEFEPEIPPISVDDLLARVGLTEVADLRADSLPTGQGRLVELARALAIRPRLLLLDEPASGQDEEETKAFAALLRSLAGEGIAILLVEHDMELVMQVCTNIFVLDFGQLMAEGDPDSVRADPKVQAAYLGTAKEVAA